MGLYQMNSMHMVDPVMERQVSQTSAASQSLQAPTLFGLQKQASASQMLSQSQMSNQALGPPYFDQVGTQGGHINRQTTLNE